MRDLSPKKKSGPARKPDIETPPPAFTYDPLSPKEQIDTTAPANEPGDQPITNTQPPKVTRGPKPKKKFLKQRWWKWLLGLGLLGSLIVFALLSFQVTRITSNPFSWGKLKGEREGRINILLLGVGDPGHAGEGLADTNMIISLDTKTNKVAMISIPRDLRVKVPGYGYQKINNAHAEGDVPLAIKTVEQNFDLPIHYFVRANFSGLEQAVDAVGGITIDVKEPLYDPEYPCDKNQYRSCGFKLKAGVTQMDGALALKYARCRKGTCGDDFGRAMRQQEVLQAIRAKATSLGTLANPAKLNALLGSAANNIKTDLSVNNVMRLSDLSKKFDSTKTINVVFSLKPNGFLTSSGTSSDLLPAGGSFSAIQNFVANVFTLGPVWKEEPTVIIQNGTATVGVAKKLSDTISGGKYGDIISIVAMTNATTRDYTTSQIIDYTGGKKPATATYLQSLVGVAPTKPPANTTGRVPAAPADFVVILGTDYITKTSTATTNSQR
jgi:LCP family protein required for cell wall assembly